MKASIVLAVILMMTYSEESLKFDFGKDKAGANWGAINDGVMGGLSKGVAYMTESTLGLTGSISLENNGGFSSLKSPYQSFDLSKIEKVKIRYRSKGQVVSVTIEDGKRFYEPYFKLKLKETKGEWKVLETNISSFKEYSLGRETSRKILREYLAKVKRIGFITNSKKEGEFDFEVDYLEFL